MTVLEELAARVRQLTDDIAAVSPAGEPIEALIAERLESLARGTADFKHAPFRLIHGASPGMLERFTLGMMGTFHPQETRAADQQRVEEATRLRRERPS
jgi:hypothetical protein